MTVKKRVADIIFDTLADLGVEQAFCVVGGGAMYLDNALGISKRIKTVFNHHEQACAMAAEGYARFHSGKKPAIVCVTTGPGGTNTLTGVMGAYVENIPMIVVAGQCRYDTSIPHSGLPLRTRGIQEFDAISTVVKMTKYAKLVLDPREVRREVQKAYDIAMTGRKGPVWLDVPLDVQSAVVDEEDLLDSLPSPKEIAPDKEAVRQVLDGMSKALRPVVIAGSAIRAAGCMDEFKEFLSRVQVPVVGACARPDVFYHSHPLYCGSEGSVGTRAGNFVLQNADYVLVLGAALSFLETGFVQKNFAPHAHVAMVNIDEYEPQKPGLAVDSFVHSDIGVFLRMTEGFSMKASADWMSYADKIKRRFGLYEGAEGNVPGRVNSYDFWKEYSAQEPEDSLTVLGNNSGVSPRLQNGCMEENQRTFDNVNCGSMGWDLPAAIGVAVASRRATTVVTGDGSVMMNIQELATVVHNKLPVRIVVFSNDGYNGIRQTCKNYFGGFNVGCDSESGISFPSFKGIAEAFGIPYRRCSDNESLQDSISWLNGQKSAAVLEVLQKYDNPPVPRVISRLRADGSSEPAWLHDMYPFIDQDEFRELCSACPQSNG